MKSRFFSLRFKLLFALTAVGILTALLICHQVYQSAVKTIRTERLAALFLLQRNKAEQIRFALREMEGNLHYFADSADVLEALSALNKSYARLPSYSSENCKTYLARFYQDMFSPAKLTYAYNQYIPEEPKALALQCMRIALEKGDALPAGVSDYAMEFKTVLSRFAPFTEMNNFDGILLVNAQGVVVFSTRTVDLGINMNSELWQGSVPAGAFRHARDSNHKDNESRIYDYAFYMPAGYTARAFASSHITEGGQFQGALIATISPRVFDNILYENSANNSWEMFLIGKDYTMRSSSRLSIENFNEYIKQQQELNATITEKIQYTRSPVLLQTVNREIAQRLVSKDTRVNTGTITTKNYRDEEMVITFAPLDLPYNLDWGIVSEISPTEFAIYADMLRRDIAEEAGLALVIIILTTFFVSRAVSAPIKRFAQVARDIAAGDYDKRFNDSSTDELGDLSKAFDDMSEALFYRREELKRANDSFIDEVNERMQTELALEKERAFASDIINSQAVLLIIVNKQGAIVHTNRMLEKLSGYHKEELAERAPTLLFDGETAERYTEAMEVATSGRTQNFTASLFTKDGKSRIIDWYISVMATLTEFTILTGIDVTEQKSVEDRLRGNESMIEFLTNSAQDAIFISDENGLIISWNIAAENMYGYKMEDILLQPVVPTLIEAKYKDQFINKKEHSLERKGKTIEVRNKRKNKDAFHAEVSMSLVSSGVDAHTMFVVRDISARIQREKELKYALDTAKNAEKAKADFLANMSHEIRTPMNGIIGFLELLKQTKLDSTQNEYLKIVNSSADSLLSIINEILDFSKLESGKMQIEKVEFNVFDELANVGELYAAKAGEKGIELLIDIDTLLPAFLIGDPLRIRQILSNLLSNALKFTPERGRIVISAEFLENKDSECVLRFAVKDTGIGISKDNQETIFDAFSQADSSVTRKYGGTGLGLAISSKFARLMGSSLALESEEGEGSTFSLVLSLPIAKADINKGAFDGYRAGILNVGMSSEVCRLLRRYLDYLGCVVTDYGMTSELTDSDELLFASPREAMVEGVTELVKHTVCVVAQEADNAFIQEHLLGVKTLYKPVHTAKLLNLLNDLTKGGAVQQRGEERSFKGKVLVAEDNPVNQQLINIVLTKMGLEVTICGNGQEAADKVLEGGFNLILMDIHMPVMNGIDATKKIIEWEQTEDITHTPIIALTANVVEENQASYAEAGMDDFLAKPIVLHELITRLEKYLEERAVTETDFFKSKAKELEIDDVEMVKMIVGEFIKQSEGQGEKAEEALKRGDFEAVVKQIRDIKNSAVSLRFTRIDAVLTRLLELTALNDKDSALYQMSILKTEVAKLKTQCAND